MNYNIFRAALMQGTQNTKNECLKKTKYVALRYIKDQGLEYPKLYFFYRGPEVLYSMCLSGGHLDAQISVFSSQVRLVRILPTLKDERLSIWNLLLNLLRRSETR